MSQAVTDAAFQALGASAEGPKSRVAGLRVLLLNQCYPPDDAPTGRYFLELAESLAVGGAKLTAIAYRWPYYGISASRRGEGLVPLPRGTVNGVEVVRVGPRLRRVVARLGKVGAFAWYAAAAVFKALLLPRSDVVIVGTSPPMLPVFARWVSRWHGARLIVWNMDLYPETLVFDGRLAKGGVGDRWLSKWRDGAFESAAAVVAIGECMADRIRQAVPRARVVALPLWPLGGISRKGAAAPSGIAGQLRVIYAGHLGAGHDIDTVAAALKLLTAEDQISVTFVTDDLPPEIRALSANAWVRALPRQSDAALTPLLATSDVHLVSLKEGALGLMVPSKALTAFVTGKPVVFVGPAGSDTGRRVSGGAGLQVNCGDAPGLVAAWRRLRDELDFRHKCGQVAKALTEGPLSAKAGLNAWLTLVSGAKGATESADVQREGHGASGAVKILR